jgi:hypothetical protein
MTRLARLCALLVLAAGCEEESARPRVRPTAPPAPLPLRPPPLPLAAAPVGAPWIAFSSAEWGFHAEFPAPPTTEVIDLTSPAGPLQMHLFVAEHDAEAYVVTVIDGPPSSGKAVTTQLDRARDGAVANVKGRLVREEQRTHADLPARRLELTAGPADESQQIFVLLILREQRLYQALVAGPADPTRASRAERFFAALQIDR